MLLIAYIKRISDKTIINLNLLRAFAVNLFRFMDKDFFIDLAVWTVVYIACVFLDISLPSSS